MKATLYINPQDVDLAIELAEKHHLSYTPIDAEIKIDLLNRVNHKIIAEIEGNVKSFNAFNSEYEMGRTVDSNHCALLAVIAMLSLILTLGLLFFWQYLVGLG
jgi:hypothetical protein